MELNSNQAKIVKTHVVHKKSDLIKYRPFRGA